MTELLKGDSRMRMSLLDVIGWVVVAVLLAFLCRRHAERICRRIPEHLEPGRPFDATPVCRRIERVRGNYLAVVCARPRDRHRVRLLHAQFCRTVRDRAYFRHQTMDHPFPAAMDNARQLG